MEIITLKGILYDTFPFVMQSKSIPNMYKNIDGMIYQVECVSLLHNYVFLFSNSLN